MRQKSRTKGTTPLKQWVLPSGHSPRFSQKIQKFLFIVTPVFLLGVAGNYGLGSLWAQEENRPLSERAARTGPVAGIPDVITLADPAGVVRYAEGVSAADGRSVALEPTPSIVGVSGRLRSFIKDGEAPDISKTLLADLSKSSPGFLDFHFITTRPASDNRAGILGSYRIGTWPGPRTTHNGAVAYTPPSGFIEVTRENQHTALSESFTVKDFLTKGQSNVWPKYLHIDLKLVDKLELILIELESQGINTSGIVVMSGFRTPSYNASGGDPRGRASLSRHMYGDAADIYIDSDGNGIMDDLNGDGRVDLKDAQVIVRAAEAVEEKHPHLVGGIGLYRANSAHGPFVHIDTRGARARW